MDRFLSLTTTLTIWDFIIILIIVLLPVIVGCCRESCNRKKAKVNHDHRMERGKNNDSKE